MSDEFKPVFCVKCGKPFFGSSTTGSCTCPQRFVPPAPGAYVTGPIQNGQFFLFNEEAVRRIVAQEVERALAAHGLIGDGN